jgi:cytochrome c oxidase cbb3-type subunit 1
MALFALASFAGVAGIAARFQSREAETPLVIDGRPNYNMGPVKFLALASLFWGLAGTLVGLYIASELAFPWLNFDTAYINFGRLRPLHTSAVIFAFGGNVLLATSFYVVQRTSRARLAGDLAPWFVALGYNFFILIAGTGYLLGITRSHEYAEPEWYAILFLVVVWVVYLLIYLGTLARRAEPHIYVANWFYLAFIVTIAMLVLGNNTELPVSIFSPKSYPVWSGVQDAMIQWWYGHNAVGFFLTAGFLAIMYYFVPKRAERPVYSYRLSIVHFWALIFLYIWAGPHHLHYTALPDWAQTLGMTFSVMLWMPSWGGMINGLMTLSGAWDKLRTDPVLRMLVVSVAFYGMSTFEGPLMSVKSVNSLSHYTDWTIGHVHSGALGWVAFVSFGALYCLIPWIYQRELYSKRLVDWHFWIATIGIVFYISSMWVAGIMQGLMWRAYTDQGYLEYSFVETVQAMHPMYVIRALGGALFVAGLVIMIYNIYKTLASPAAVAAPEAGAPQLAPAE